MSQKKYQIIYADPPWKYNNDLIGRIDMGGKTYKAMDIGDIASLPIKDITDKNCALFLWVTMPKIEQGLWIIREWGFKYITCAFTWVKQNPKNNGIYSGLGHWTNGNAELCLFAKKGRPKRIAKNIKQIVLAHRSRHSEKPAEVRQRITDLLGELPRIELFARQKTEGWDVWGNEVESDIKI